MKLPIEHEYSSCVAYTRDLELYTAWVDEQLAAAQQRIEQLEKDASRLILLGEHREHGVVWFDANPHGCPMGTKYYAALEQKEIVE